MTPGESHYYPPRKASWRRHVADVEPWLRRLVGWERIRASLGTPLGQFCTALIVPGYSLRWTRFRAFRTHCGILYGCCVLLACAGAGRWVADIAIGLMLGIHTTSLVALAGRSSLNPTVLNILGVTGFALTALQYVVYRPIGHFVLDNLFLPLTMRGEVIVVRPRVDPHRLIAGNTVAYLLRSRHVALDHTGVLSEEGYGIERVLGLPGDHIEFFTQGVQINGIVHEREYRMPSRGELTLPPGTWFIWPHLSEAGRGIEPEVVSSIYLRLALVSERDLVGTPFNRWFGFQQRIP